MPHDPLAELRALALRAQSTPASFQTLEAVKQGLVLPFLQCLGYQVLDPSEVRPCPGPESGIPGEGRPDYAVMLAGSPAFWIECRPLGSPLETHPPETLHKAVAHTPCRLGCLTDGRNYGFHLDLQTPGNMDPLPFWTLDLEALTEQDRPLLNHLQRDGFDPGRMRELALDVSRHAPALQQVLQAEMVQPSPELVRLLVSRIYAGPWSEELARRWALGIAQAFRSLERNQLQTRLSRVMDLPGPPEPGNLGKELDAAPTLLMPPVIEGRAAEPATLTDPGPDLALDLDLLDTPDEPSHRAASRVSLTVGASALVLGLIAGVLYFRHPAPPPPQEPASRSLAAVAPSPFDSHLAAGDLDAISRCAGAYLHASEGFVLRLAVISEPQSLRHICTTLGERRKDLALAPMVLKDGRKAFQVLLGPFASADEAKATAIAMAQTVRPPNGAPIVFAIPDLPKLSAPM